MIIEICASNYQSAINAQEAGAQRIELCSELAIGGITPSYGLVKTAVDVLSIPVYVLIRPRSGNFTYTNSEFEIMKHNIQLCKDLGCSGIVSGVLNKDNTINVEQTKELIELSKPLPFTFHRAFDWTPNPSEAIKELIKLGVERVLTSGQETAAEQGIKLLANLKQLANDKIIVLPGGGINSENIRSFKALGFTEVHASATTLSQINKVPKIPMNSSKFFDETINVVSDKSKIKALVNNSNE
ncbi:copper homeostasis protein CutC [Pontimicrobium sp. MEBiC01747]